MTRWWRPLRSSAPTLQQTHKTNFGIGTRSPAGARPTEGPIVHRRVRHIQSTAVQAHQPPLPVPGSLGALLRKGRHHRVIKLLHGPGSQTAARLRNPRFAGYLHLHRGVQLATANPPTGSAAPRGTKTAYTAPTR